MEKNNDKNEPNNEKLEKIINEAMEASDIIAFKSILKKYHIEYDNNVNTLKELKDNVLKNCSNDISKKILEEFELYKNQSLSVMKNFDPNNLTKFKAEQVIKSIGSVASPIAKTLTKSALTIAMYQGLYLLPFPLKLGIAGTMFATKRLPKVLKSSKEMLKKFKKENGGLKHISKKVVGTVIAGGLGVGAMTILNYISKGAIPEEVLNKLPGIKESLRFISPTKLRKAVTVGLGVTKGIDVYNLRKQEITLVQPIIKGFFVAKGIKIDEELNSFKDVEKYVNKLDDEGKYELKQYLNKCIAMKKMADRPEEKIKKVGKTVIKIVSDAFETASYLALFQPLGANKKDNNKNDDLETEPETEPEVVQNEEDVMINVPDGKKVMVEHPNGKIVRAKVPNGKKVIPQKQPAISKEPTLGNEVRHHNNETLPTSNIKDVSKNNINIPENEYIEPEIEADPQDMAKVVEEYEKRKQERAKAIVDGFKKSSLTQWKEILNNCLENSDKLLGAASIGTAAALLCEIITTYGPYVLIL